MHVCIVDHEGQARFTRKILSPNQLDGERKVDHLLRRAPGAPS